MFEHGFIEVHDANQNNLQHVNVKIPKDAITVFVGRSGSGKSSLVFDTIAAESRRELNETLPSNIYQSMASLMSARLITCRLPLWWSKNVSGKTLAQL